MNYNIIDLKTHIGSEKTLVISGNGPDTDKYHPFVDSVYVSNIPQGMLFPYDPQQQEMLLHHVFEKECSQIIYVAPSQSAFLEYLEKIDSPRSLHLAVKFHLSVLLRKQEDRAIPDHIRRQILLELYAIKQCKLLMDYFFIRKKIEQGDLKLKGLVTQISTGHIKSIFFNGIAYNTLLTLN
jgi:hypothetical protein